jgi:hypothetical protein
VVSINDLTKPKTIQFIFNIFFLNIIRLEFIFYIEITHFHPDFAPCKQGVDVVEWSRALDVRPGEWCCSVSMVWVQIPSREEQKLSYNY